jgi:hypothetical protein
MLPLTFSLDLMATRKPRARTLSVRMHRALWVGQVLLAVFFLLAGYYHGIKPLHETASIAPWVAIAPPRFVRFIGWAELLGAVSLVLPALVRSGMALVPFAALGFALLMALAVTFHVLLGEISIIGLHIAVSLLALFVAGGRLTPPPLKPHA